MYMVVIFSFPFFLVLVLLVFLWSSLCLVVTTFRPHQKRARHRNVVTTRHKDDHRNTSKTRTRKSRKEKITTMYIQKQTQTCVHIRVYVVPKTHAPRHTRKQTSTQNHNNMNKRADTRAPHIIHKSAHACKITSRHKERAFHLTRLMAAGPPSTLTSRSITLCRHTYSHCSNSF